MGQVDEEKGDRGKKNKGDSKRYELQGQLGGSRTLRKKTNISSLSLHTRLFVEATLPSILQEEKIAQMKVPR